jgi:hypothetical protein
VVTRDAVRFAVDVEAGVGEDACTARSAVVNTALRTWRDASEPWASCLFGGRWRDECFAVYEGQYGRGSPLFVVERSGIGLLGCTAYGCHLNGYVRDASGMRITGVWIAKRSLFQDQKSTDRLLVVAFACSVDLYELKSSYAAPGCITYNQ